MIASALSTYRISRARARRTWSWMKRHPKTTLLLILGTWWLVSAILAVPAAYADGAATSSAPPYMPPLELKDSHGVSLWRYAVLPLDRGDVWHPMKTAWSAATDGVWTFNLASLAWCLWLMSFLLEFTWVDWIATPVDSIAQIMQSIVGQIGWPALAMMMAGGVFVLSLVFGRTARGAVDLGVSLLCFVLATGALANPVGLLTGNDGVLAHAEATGANLSASVLSPDGSDPTGTPDKKDAQKIISSSLMGGLIDVFVRLPAQEIAFGHSLSGDCDTTFTEQMKKASPFDTTSTSVRDAVGKCDKNAQEYVTHPGFGQVMSAVFVLGGSGTLNLISVAISLAALISVFYALWNATKLIINVNAAMAPGVARESLWRSLIGTYVGAWMLCFAIVALAVYLVVLQGVMKAVSKAGLSIVAQTTIIDLIVIALIITLIVGLIRMRKSGKRLASWLASLGRGAGSQKQGMSPLAKEGLRTAGRYAANKLSQPRQRPQLPSAPETIDGGHLTATSNRRPSGGGGTGSKFAGAVRAASTVGQLTAAAASGGTSAVAMKAMQVGGKKVLQRQVLSRVPSSGGKGLAKNALGTALPGSYATAAGGAARGDGATPFGRQIVVDKTGVGRVAPVLPDSNGVYQATRLRARPRSLEQSPLRAALERAAKQQQEPSEVGA